MIKLHITQAKLVPHFSTQKIILKVVILHNPLLNFVFIDRKLYLYFYITLFFGQQTKQVQPNFSSYHLIKFEHFITIVWSIDKASSIQPNFSSYHLIEFEQFHNYCLRNILGGLSSSTPLYMLQLNLNIPNITCILVQYLISSWLRFHQNSSSVA